MPRRLVLVVALLAALAAGCDWPMFGYNPAHTRFSADKSISLGDLPTRMQTAWTAAVPTSSFQYSSPAVANGVLYVGGNDGKLYAFDASGSVNCTGTPATCTPLWTAATGGPVRSSPTVANGVVYVGSNDDKLYAFDARGITGCSGTPKTCQPLWTGATAGVILSSPTVVNGVVYVSSFDRRVYAFDAAGSSGCSGTPTTCAPLWMSTQVGGGQPSPTVVNGVVYVGDEARNIAAFDAGGSTNCSGTPKVCAPLWTAMDTSVVEGTIPVSNGRAYVPGGTLQVYDAAGSTNCSGTPVTCTPLWTAATGGSAIASPAIANGVLYEPASNHELDAFDAAGVTNCSGTPVTCTPLWSASIGTQNVAITSSPAVANGVVYVGSEDGNLYAFDATGTTNCSGTPVTCTPLWTVATGGPVRSAPAVANGFVYVTSNNQLQAYVDDTQPPRTTVDAPASGSTVSGPTTLLETAFDNVSVSKVEFRVTGGNLDDALIGVATPSGHGGSFGWDTTSVPNGDYTLNSVAYDEVGNVGRSGDVDITVQN